LSLRLLLSCGEASGDLYAGALTRELLALDPAMTVCGLGGPRFAAAGGTLVDDYRGVNATGLIEPFAKLPRLVAARRRMIDAAHARPPDALVLIDFSGFNFRLAPAIKRLGVPVIYYISPQIWASRPGRLTTMRAIADRVLVIFPFEAAIYERGGVPVEFVGHPLIDLATPSASRDVFLRGLGLTPSAPTIAILPGSRPNEVSRILPDLAAAAQLIRRQVPGAQFRWPARRISTTPCSTRCAPARAARGSRWSRATPTRCWRRPTSRSWRRAPPPCRRRSTTRR
jgi:lipid-A-disaccharide synthase